MLRYFFILISVSSGVCAEEANLFPVSSTHSDSEILKLDYGKSWTKTKKIGDLTYDGAKSCLNSLNTGSFYEKAGGFDHYMLLPHSGDSMAIYDEKSKSYKSFKIPADESQPFYFDENTYFRVKGKKITFYENNPSVAPKRISFDNFGENKFNKLQKKHVNQAIHNSVELYSKLKSPSLKQTELALSLFKCSKIKGSLSYETEKEVNKILDSHYKYRANKRYPTSRGSTVDSPKQKENWPQSGSSRN